jgi:hypothetical protein
VSVAMSANVSGPGHVGRVTVTSPFWRYDVEALREHRHLGRPRLVGAQATVQEDEGFAGSLLAVPGVDTVDVDVLTHPVPPVSRPHLHVTVLQVTCGISALHTALQPATYDLVRLGNLPPLRRRRRRLFRGCGLPWWPDRCRRSDAKLATCELNHPDVTVDIGGFKFGGDHASIPKLVEPMGRHLVHTDRRQARPTIRLERCLDLAATLSMLGVTIIRSTP